MRKLIKKILKEDDWDFVRDVKSNQDIAQEIADETKIKDNRLYLPYLPSSFLLLLPPTSLRFHLSPLSPPTFFTRYCKVEYGLDKKDANDVWKRYEDIIKVNNLNESDDMQWIKDIEPYIPFDEVVIGGKYAVQVMDRYQFEIALEGCGEEIYDIPLYVIVEKKAKLEYGDIYCWGRNSDVVPHWDGVKECLKLTFYNKHDDYLVDHWLAPDGLIRLVNVF